MRLADFLATNLEPILAEWEAFARTHVPVGEAMDVAGLRDHAADILGHDVRTPLGAIMMSATGLLLTPALSPPQEAAASRILNSGTRIKQIVGDLLDFTRTRLGAGIPLTCVDMDLGTVGRRVAEE